MVEERTLETPQFSKLHYKKQGAGKVLMLLHGFPENSGLWKLILPALSAHFTVIAPDLPGAGKSASGELELTIDYLAQAVKFIADKEAVEEMVIAGHSMGGYVALAFAEKYPEFLKGLSLIHSTATADDDARKEKRRKTIEIIKKGGKDAFMKELIPALFSAKFRSEEKDIIATQIKRGNELSDESILSFYTAMMKRPDKTATLKNAAYPVQMIIGKEETLAPMNILLAQAAMAAVSFISVYENSLHMSMIEHPQRLADDLLNFTQYCFNR